MADNPVVAARGFEKQCALREPLIKSLVAETDFWISNSAGFASFA